VSRKKWRKVKHETFLHVFASYRLLNIFTGAFAQKNFETCAHNSHRIQSRQRRSPVLKIVYYLIQNLMCTMYTLNMSVNKFIWSSKCGHELAQSPKDQPRIYCSACLALCCRMDHFSPRLWFEKQPAIKYARNDTKWRKISSFSVSVGQSAAQIMIRDFPGRRSQGDAVMLQMQICHLDEWRHRRWSK